MSAKNELHVNPKDVKIIQDWLIAQPHLPDKLDEMIIKRFLVACNHSLQVAKSTIDVYFTIRWNGPEIFSNRDPLSKEIQQVYTVSQFVPLPKLTKENYKLFVCRLIDFDHENFHFNNQVKAFFMMVDIRIWKEDVLTAGEVPIFDMEGVNLKYLTRVVLPTLKRFMEYNQEGLPIKLRQIHVLNASAVIHKMFPIVKQFMNSAVLKAVVFHEPGSTTLYDYVPKELLPEEYGGNVGSMKALSEEWIRRVANERDYFLDEEQWRVDESRRPSESRDANPHSVHGSFKTLSLD